MKIVGFSYNKISAKKSKEVAPPLKVNTNIEVLSIKKIDIDVFRQGDVFDFEYEFKITYGLDSGEVFFSGHILALIEDRETSELIQKNWETKTISEDIKIPLMNLTFGKCNLKALQLEEDLNLPAHLPAPQLVRQEGKPQFNTNFEEDDSLKKSKSESKKSKK